MKRNIGSVEMMIKGIVFLLLICFIIILMNSKTYIVKEFGRSILISDYIASEQSDTGSLITNSSQVDVKRIHSGNLIVDLSNPLNLDDPLCSGMSNEKIQIPVFAYLLHHKKYGYFLIDSGCEATYSDHAYGPMKGFLLPFVMPKTNLKAADAIENQLPADVQSQLKGIFFTHLHFDHTAGIPALPDNLIYIAGKGEKTYSVKGILDGNHFKKSDIIYRMDFDEDIADTFPVGKAIDIFGDSSVWAISTPGHSKGHVSYLINRENGPLLITGDACNLKKNFEMGVGSGTSSTDKEKDQETLNKIITFVKSNPGMEVWFGHDEEIDRYEGKINTEGVSK